jgi:hypothetical protein
MFVFGPYVAKRFVAVVVVNRMHKQESAKFDNARKGENLELLK